MTLRFIDWIWHIRGSLALAPEQASGDAFDRLAPLFDQTGTSHHRTNDTLVFQKKDQAAQDKMAVFDGGVLQIVRGKSGPAMRYDMTSRILLFCFLAPLLFLGIAQLTVAMGKIEKPSSEAASKSEKAAEAKRKLAAKEADVPMNPIDKALGAPAPEKPGKKDADKAHGRDRKPSPTPAYVFAAIFAILYVVGRILEDRLVRSLLRNSLLASPSDPRARLDRRPSGRTADPGVGQAAL